VGSKSGHPTCDQIIVLIALYRATAALRQASVGTRSASVAKERRRGLAAATAAADDVEHVERLHVNQADVCSWSIPDIGPAGDARSDAPHHQARASRRSAIPLAATSIWRSITWIATATSGAAGSWIASAAPSPRSDPPVPLHRGSMRIRHIEQALLSAVPSAKGETVLLSGSMRREVLPPS
jgi:hypothetical protein